MLTTSQACPALTARPQMHAVRDALKTPQRRASKPPPSLYGRDAPAGQQALQLGTACRSLDGFQKFANIGNGHPSAHGLNLGNGAAWVSYPSNPDFPGVHFGANGFVIQAITSGEGSRLDIDKCLHLFSPVDVSNIAHLALINNTFYRKVSAC